MFKKLFGLVAALLFSVAAHAVIPAVQGYHYGAVGSGGGHASLEAWSTWFAAPRNYTPTGCTGVWSNNVSTCNFTANSTGNPVSLQVQRYPAGLVCPANATLSGSNCTCNTGYAESGNQCVPVSPECQIGQGRTFNRTEGWGRSGDANADDLVANYGPPGSAYGYNDGVCVGDIAKVERCYRSQEPSPQGLYRVSCDYTMVVSSASTSPGDVHADPENDNAACPGVVGTVNGKPLCVGTASNPLPSNTAPPNKPTSAGNPAAGEKPASGEGSGSTGSGRTPSGGSGGNSGGPASAAVGRGGSGDRGDGTEDSGAVCGAPPLPACNVKVDETGTPAEATAPARYGDATTKLNEQTDAWKQVLDDAKEIELPGWSWSFSFPTGCTPLVLSSFDDMVIDVCEFQPVIHDLMGMLWVAAGLFGLLALFRETFGGA